MKTSHHRYPIRPVLFLMAVLVLSSCDLIRDIGRYLSTSTIIYYTPITYCNGLYDVEGSSLVGGEPVLIEEVFVYRLDVIENNQSSDVSLHAGYFYLLLHNARLASRAARRLTTIPEPLNLTPGGRIESPGLVAMRFDDPDRSRLMRTVPGTGECGIDECYQVKFLPLQYDPALRGEPRPYVAFNTHGVQTRIVDPRPCRVDEVLALATRTP